MSTKPDKPDTPDAHTTSLCSVAAWADKHVSLRHVSSQFSLPTVARVVSGRYRGIAPADSKHHHHHHHHHHSSSRRSSSIVFIQSVRTSQKVRSLSLSLSLCLPIRHVHASNDTTVHCPCLFSFFILHGVVRHPLQFTFIHILSCHPFCFPRLTQPVFLYGRAKKVTP